MITKSKICIAHFTLKLQNCRKYCNHFESYNVKVVCTLDQMITWPQLWVWMVFKTTGP